MFAIIYTIIFASILASDRDATLIPISILTIFPILRGNVGYDTCNYKDIYSQIGVVDYDDLSYLEPGFLVLATLLKLISDNSQFILISIGLMQGFVLYKISKSINNSKFFLLIFVAVFYYSYFYSLIRQALATLILSYAYAIYLKNGSRNYWLSFLSFGIHYSVLPVILLLRPTANQIAIVVVLIIALFTYDNNFFIGLADLAPIMKLDNTLQGVYNQDRAVSWHVYLSYLLMALVVITTVPGAVNILMYFIMIPVMMAADLYFFKSGRIALVAMTCLFVLHSNNWTSYRFSKKAITLVYYSYLIFYTR